jgi:hypothetical protein
LLALQQSPGDHKGIFPAVSLVGYLSLLEWQAGSEFIQQGAIWLAILKDRGSAGWGAG